jgi:hypothetical protein
MIKILKQGGITYHLSKECSEKITLMKKYTYLKVHLTLSKRLK